MLRYCEYKLLVMKKEIVGDDVDKVLRSSYLASQVVRSLEQNIKIEEELFSEEEKISIYNSIDKDEDIKREIIAKVMVVDVEKVAKSFSYKLSISSKRKNVNRKIRIAIASAAAAVIAITLAQFQLMKDENNIHSQVIVTPQIIAEVVQVEDKPVIIFDDKEEIVLAEAESASIKEIEKDREDVIKSVIEEKVSKVTLITPTQMHQNMTLEDGTVVTLNSKSKLVFPSKFSDDKREVTLEGEAYFKVAKSSKPFIVKVNDNYIRVYGTEFNVNNRKDGVVETVLVEGSVGIGADNDIVMMKPNQLAVVDCRKGKVDIENVNPSNYIAWKDGYFEFIGKSFNEVLSEISNWYGATIKYDSSMFEKVKLNMSFKKEVSLEEALNKIDKAINISVTVNDNAHEIKRR